MTTTDPQEQLAELLAQEDALQFTRFDNDTALDLGMALVRRAQDGGKAITIDVCRNGQQLFHVALAGTSADNDAWVQRKNRVVNRYGHSSFYIGQMCKAQGTTFEARSRLDPDLYAASGGGFPLIVRGVGVVGTLTISGLPQQEDHELLVSVLREFLAAH